MSDIDEPPCPVCGGEMEDTRHVAVECFYDVHEVAPSAGKVEVLLPIGEQVDAWGITRRYPEGTRDRRQTVPGPERNSLVAETVQEPTPPVRLLEASMYSVNCCKSCRGDFLTMFGAWVRGDLALPSEPSEEACVPIRVNGAVRYVTEEEWHRRRAAEG